MGKPKLCIFLVVSGQYAHYIPYFLHCIETAYPEYHVIINYQGKLPIAVSESLRWFSNDRFIVHENTYSGYFEDPNTIKTLRWLTVLGEFYSYDYIYIGDIDILITKEEPGLLDQHIKLCEAENICYSNTCNIDPIETRGNRMTGLHFFKQRPYFKLMLPVIQKYVKLIREKGIENIPEFYNETMQRIDNQHALWQMINESGLSMPKHSFFRYHGLHLGHSRCENRWKELFTNCELHKSYYIEFMRNANNKRFWKIYKNSIPEIRIEINKMLVSGKKYV